MIFLKLFQTYFIIFLLLFSMIAIHSSVSKDNKFFEKEINETPDIARFEKIVKELFPEDEPAGAVLIMKEEKILFENYYGLSFLPNGTKIDMNSNFCIASISKQFTAVAILQLVSQGKVSLDEPLKTYFPEYTNPLWGKVKLRHLLSHCSGIPDERGYLNRSQKIYGDENLALEYLTNLTKLHFEPGSTYEYENPTFVLIGRLIERITNKTFVDYVQENIFTPAGMTNTAYIFQEKNACHAYEYDRDEGDSEESSGDRPPGPHDWYEYDYGEETFFATRPDGGIYSNPRDFIKWEKALPSLLSKDLLSEAYKPQIKVSGSPWSDYQNRPGTYYGYGWFIEPEKKCIYHTGDNGGFKNLAAKYPDKEAFVIVFSARADWDRYGLKTQIEEIFDLVPKFNEKLIYIQQIQKINKKLKIFCLSNFAILKNDTFNFSLNLYSITPEKRLKENEIKDFEFLSLGNYGGFTDNIIELESKEELDENTGVILEEMKSDNNIKTKLNENKNNLDSEKVKEEINKGGINYNNITSNYQFYNYPIVFSNEGCEFYLNTNINIENANTKNINLYFKEANNDNNKIKAECILSKDNKNKIPCKLDKEINQNYILEPFIYSDNIETISIFQNITNDYFSLKCDKPNEGDGLSIGVILGIIFGGIGIIAVIIIIIYIVRRKRNNKDDIDEGLIENIKDI